MTEYESPIDVIVGEFEMKMEGDIMKSVQRVGINVDKEELLKALDYDRGQFEKGYLSAKKEYERPRAEWIEHRQLSPMGYFVSEYECSNCHDDVWQKTEWQFCPNCGADMRKERR